MIVQLSKLNRLPQDLWLSVMQISRLLMIGAIFSAHTISHKLFESSEVPLGVLSMGIRGLQLPWLGLARLVGSSQARASRSVRRRLGC